MNADNPHSGTPRGNSNTIYVECLGGVRPPASDFHFRKQVDFLVNHSGKISMDFIGRFEDLDAGIRELSKALNVDPGLLEKVNSSTHKDFRKYYDSEMVDIVSDLYRDDIEAFGYEFRI